MSRAGYTDDFAGDWDLIRYRGAVASAIRGRRGQAFLRRMIEALDAMPEKRLVIETFWDRPRGEFCALGAVARHMHLPELSTDQERDHDFLAEAFDIAQAMVREIEFENDEAWVCSETPEARWARMRRWAESHLAAEVPS